MKAPAEDELQNRIAQQHCQERYREGPEAAVEVLPNNAIAAVAEAPARQGSGAAGRVRLRTQRITVHVVDGKGAVDAVQVDSCTGARRRQRPARFPSTPHLDSPLVMGDQDDVEQ